MGEVTLIVGIASFLITLTQFVKGIRAHLCVRKLDIALSRQRLLEEYDDLIELGVQIQMCAHPLILEKADSEEVRLLLGAEEIRLFKEAVENVNANVAVNHETREIIIDSFAITPHDIKLFESLAALSKSSYLRISKIMPPELKMDALIEEINKSC